MQFDPQVVRQIAAEVVLRLERDRELDVRPLRTDALEQEVTDALHTALVREDALRTLVEVRGEEGFEARVRHYARLTGTPRGTGRGIFSVVETLIATLRQSEHVERVSADDIGLLRSILSVIARPSKEGRNRSGGSGSQPPPDGGPGGASPAEVRAWHVPRGPLRDERDPDRQERPVRSPEEPPRRRKGAA